MIAVLNHSPNHNQNFFELPSLSFVQFSSAYSSHQQIKPGCMPWLLYCSVPSGSGQMICGYGCWRINLNNVGMIEPKVSILCQVGFMDDGVECGAIWADFHHNQVNSSQFWRSTRQNSSINSFETSSLSYEMIILVNCLVPRLSPQP